MSQSVIRVEGLCKQYAIGARERQGETFREMLTASLAAPFRRLARLRGEVAEEERIWALRDITFEVKSGEVIGFIGRNGAGKSTLLKILSRVTAPTEGRVEIRGRVSSLLEVGTGFHGELTGRENIFLNGAILGMRRQEIARKFDEIVAFAEVDKFIDTPVKRYSSGMYVRLAFAVAAHVEPEILIVDEVLAVGDSEFQRKCLGKMSEFASGNRTVLFVSHNIAAIRQLCQNAAWLDQGRLRRYGPCGEVVEQYYADLSHQETSLSWKNTGAPTGNRATIMRLQISSDAGRGTPGIVQGDSVAIAMDVAFREEVIKPQFGVFIQDADGTTILDFRSLQSGFEMNKARGAFTVAASIAALNLYPGDYQLSAWVGDFIAPEIDRVQSALRFSVLPSGRMLGGPRMNFDAAKYFVPSTWRHVARDETASPPLAPVSQPL